MCSYIPGALSLETIFMIALLFNVSDDGCNEAATLSFRHP
jgi:hypothetical protein